MKNGTTDVWKNNREAVLQKYKKKRLPKLPLDKLTETIIAANTIIDPT